jgi:hypothetical protein
MLVHSLIKDIPMKRDIFEIRGNITPTIKRLEQLAKEREEREKAEREAKWERERKEREEKDRLFKIEHPVLDAYTYISAYNFDTYSWPGDYVNIRFYEWSNINCEPKFFSHSIPFYRFLDECKINLTPDQNGKIKGNSGCYITCIPGTHDLIIVKSYDELKTEFHKASNLAKILEPVPEVSSTLPCIVDYDDD